MSYLASLATQLSWSFYLQFFAWLALLAVVFLYVRKKKFWGYSVVYALLGVLVLRMFLFENPFSWTVYSYMLSLDDVGFWDKSIIGREKSRYTGHPVNVRYLAVGSSQVEAIFGDYAKQHDENLLDVFSIPGMLPMSYVLYREQIASYKPSTVILYLSEFDLGKPPKPGQWKMAPPQGWYTWRLYSLVKKGFGNEPPGPEFSQMVVANWIPEYKYNFVFRSLLDKAVAKLEPVKETRLSEIPASDMLAMHLKRFQGLTDKHIRFHLLFLKEFVAFCEQRHIKVVIVEGDYNPLGHSEKNDELNKRVRQHLITLANENSDVTFLPRNAVYQVKAGDFRDGTHVKPAVGLEFTRRLLAQIEQTGNEGQVRTTP